jgi:uncharacterized repeat protein (TIGR03843 family)
VDVDESIDPVALVNDADPRLRPIALFDAIVNNADRKVGHLLPRPDGILQGVDHGVTFHREPKLRTVLWAWRGQQITADEAAIIARLRDALAGALGRELREHLTATEVRLTRRRADRLLETGRFPQPDPDRPAIPWPPY